MRSQKGWRWQSPTSHHPPCHLGLSGKDDCHSHRELCREMVRPSLVLEDHLKMSNLCHTSSWYVLLLWSTLHVINYTAFVIILDIWCYCPIAFSVTPLFPLTSFPPVIAFCKMQVVMTLYKDDCITCVPPPGLCGSLHVRWCWCLSTPPVRITPRGQVSHSHLYLSAFRIITRMQAFVLVKHLY